MVHEKEPLASPRILLLSMKNPGSSGRGKIAPSFPNMKTTDDIVGLSSAITIRTNFLLFLFTFQCTTNANTKIEASSPKPVTMNISFEGTFFFSLEPPA
ncbi:hypothetical protein Leryth_005946 [Lithospermum erythrorhizon]|nr:hypothetical protein Leryth_005946 [Lithospermum erythrorhizon]